MRGALDAETLRYTGHSEQCPKSIVMSVSKGVCRDEGLCECAQEVTEDVSLGSQDCTGKSF